MRLNYALGWLAAADNQAPTTQSSTSSGPWRLSEALGLPDHIRITGSHRQRYESVINQFRSGREGDAHLWPIRTLLHGQYHTEDFVIGAELQDSRAYDDNNNTPVGTSSVNPVELLQAYVKVPFESDEYKGHVRGGRITVDFGSRRLVARNRYRNTINAFTGLEGEVQHSSGWRAQWMFALPIQRRPLDSSKLRDNKAEFDREDEEVFFWGLFARSPESGDGVRGEFYFFGLSEEDTSDRSTRDRELYTPGCRFYREPSAENVDFQVETVLQFGNSRLSTAPTAARLEHFAYYLHGTLGYTTAAEWSPRIALQFDYASGDRRPGDSRNGRFDTLFGARRFEYGPTGIYGAFARSNIMSPGLRIEVKPHSTVSSFLAYRPFWLAAQRDAWTTSGFQDPGGDSGDFLGHQLDWRLRWDIIPKSVRFECGCAYLIRGEFPRDVAGGNSGDPLAMYVQTAWTF
ncbi:MAG: alginate export family protein [Planctomycetota bacterium]